jgi:hypothetical protein
MQITILIGDNVSFYSNINRVGKVINLTRSRSRARIQYHLNTGEERNCWRKISDIIFISHDEKIEWRELSLYPEDLIMSKFF